MGFIRLIPPGGCRLRAESRHPGDRFPEILSLRMVRAAEAFAAGTVDVRPAERLGAEVVLAVRNVLGRGARIKFIMHGLQPKPARSAEGPISCCGRSLKIRGV